ncbi:hypothetical protein NF865_07700 [Thermococcus aggregans]|uniref:Uncharacterized protein n=1 Tax=Thermococcus aggregans TaxID=110163 RepID=A0A9E7SNF2_THEAG|nr:hypothetical protein [Thermococcus aggregans]USS40209.1 hypothetical protein NF865_07700 [Thermococcus aggregans]
MIRREVIPLEAVLLVWGVRDDVLRELPIKGYWLYGEYDFIAVLTFENREKLEEFKQKLNCIIGDGKFKVCPVRYSARSSP